MIIDIIVIALIAVVLNNQRIIKSNQVEMYKVMDEKEQGLDKLIVRIDDMLGREGK